MEIQDVSRGKFLRTVGLGIVASIIIVIAAAGIGRATVNLKGALTDKPDIAIYLLLPEEEIGKVELLSEQENERHYLAHTKTGPKFVILKKGEEEWYVSSVENLHEDATDASKEELQEETEQ